jgi:hypothetical protein
VVGVVPYRHYGREEKELILAAVGEVQGIVRAPMKAILKHIGISRSTYYRWLKRASDDCLADRTIISHRRAWPPTPQEIDSVCGYALEYPQMGYKRLTWQMLDDDVAYLKPYQVYEILSGHSLLRSSKDSGSETLKRPPEPDHPDEVWHVDLMYLYIHPRWYHRRIQPFSGELESEFDHGVRDSDRDSSGCIIEACCRENWGATDYS